MEEKRLDLIPAPEGGGWRAVPARISIVGSRRRSVRPLSKHTA